MTANIKQGKGWCTLYTSRDKPFVIYRTDNGKPILDENEIILIKTSNATKLRLNSSCRYGYLRWSILESDYDPVRSRLTRDNFYELRKIVNKKLERLGEVTLDDFVEGNY